MPCVLSHLTHLRSFSRLPLVSNGLLDSWTPGLLEEVSSDSPGGLFEGPVQTKTENESVATSYTSERKDYSNSEGRRLLAHINNSSKAPNEPGPVFVTDRSQEFGGGKNDYVDGTRNLVETSREEKQKAAVPALVQVSKERSSSADSESQTNIKVDN